MAGEVVVVTGGTAGVGRATATAFARDGAAAVAVLARGRERLADTQAELERLGVRALALEADVADPEAVDAAATRVEDELGPIDVWVNNAMATVFGRFVDVEPEEYRRSTDVTYLGTVWGTRAALARMRPRNRGTIVQVGSALAYRAIPLQAPYCAAKHAVQGFTEALRTELMHDGVDVHLTMVQLPALNTPQFDWGRNKVGRRPQPVPPIFQPEVAADAIVWAARNRRRELVVGFPALKAIVGNKLAPGLADRYLARTGFDAQTTEAEARVDAADNLFAPVPGHQGAHGRFDAQARSHSLHSALTRHRRLVAVAASGLAALAAGAVAAGRD